jgi:hypothetical protein
VESLRWAMNSANSSDATALLAERLKIAPDIAAATYEIAANRTTGLAPDAGLDLEGFRNVLALRAELEGAWAGTPPSPNKYLDLSYYQRALANVGK